MNPAFAIIVVVLCICVWFLAAFLYKPIGKFIYKIGKDAVDELNYTEDEDKEKEG